MPVDPAGTAPGLASPATGDALKTVHMKCRRPECDSIVALDVPHPNSLSGRRMYQCVKCRTSWGASVGGALDI